MDRSLLEYLPEHMRIYREMQEITGQEENEIKGIYEALESISKNSFIEDAEEWGIAKYEGILGLYPESGSDLESRRFRVKAALLDYSGYTLFSLKKYLTSILGADGYILELNNQEYEITVKIIIRERDKYDIIASYLEKNIPANMVIRAYIDCNHNSWLTIYRHSELKSKTHKQMKEEVLQNE